VIEALAGFADEGVNDRNEPRLNIYLIRLDDSNTLCSRHLFGTLHK